MKTNNNKISRNSVWGGYMLWITVTLLVIIGTASALHPTFAPWMFWGALLSGVVAAFLSHMLIHPKSVAGYVLCGGMTFLFGHLLASLGFVILKGQYVPCDSVTTFYDATMTQLCTVGWISAVLLLGVSAVYGALPLRKRK